VQPLQDGQRHLAHEHDLPLADGWPVRSGEQGARQYTYAASPAIGPVHGSIACHGQIIATTRFTPPCAPLRSRWSIVGRPCPCPCCRTRWGTARTDKVNALLRERDDILAESCERLLQAQHLSKKYYNASHRDLEFTVGDWVWLRLLHRTAQSLEPRTKLV
jgi:hypothetical protein